ncbi:exosortase family protein XrtM [Methylomonas sp. AM2-LC]|uniref:exosortase family protein XrtM n=1 Tax=Methylomonas sp. AM2-LC TaxID=3153301 RepID=UPI003267CD1A
MLIKNTYHFSMAAYYGWLQCILFIGCYVLLDYGYFTIPEEWFTQVIHYRWMGVICADFINMIAPLEQVSAAENHLRSAKAGMDIVRGCDGAGVLFLLVSAILVFPSKLSRKVTGLLLGISFIYGINLLRISALYFIVAYYPDWFMLIHLYFSPTLMVIAACAYFALWAYGTTKMLHESA